MFERDTGCPGSQSNGYPQDPVKQDRGHPRVLPGLTIGQPASSSKPKHPDPQSQSLSRSYGSNLPTSLTYIILSTRGYSPRTCCGYGYELMRLRCNPQPDFQGSTRHSWTQRELLRSLPSQNPFSPRRNSRASAAYAEKTTLPRARVDVSGSFHVAMLIRGSNSSAIRLRNKDLIPFRPKLWSLQIENTTQFYRVSPKP